MGVEDWLGAARPHSRLSFGEIAQPTGRERYARAMRKHNLTWRRALIELLIVAAGVLLALALDQWLENRKERAEEALLLRSVRTEIKSILKEMEAELVFRQAMLDNANHIYALAVADTPPDPKVFDEMLGKLLWWSSVDFTIGAVNSILVGGKLRLIENEEIRFFLASLPERLVATKQVEANDYSTLMSFSVPYVMKHADLPQIVMTMTVRPGGLVRSEPELRYHPKTPRNHTELLKDSEFLGVVTGVATSQINVVVAYDDILPEFERVVGLLDAELGVPG